MKKLVRKWSGLMLTGALCLGLAGGTAEMAHASSTFAGAGICIGEAQFEAMLPEDVTLDLFLTELSCLPPSMEDGAVDDWHYSLLVVTLMAKLHSRDGVVTQDYPMDYLNRLLSPVTSRRLTPETDPSWVADDGTVYYAWNPVTGIDIAKLSLQEIWKTDDGVRLLYHYDALDETEVVTASYDLEAIMLRDAADDHLYLWTIRESSEEAWNGPTFGTGAGGASEAGGEQGQAAQSGNGQAYDAQSGEAPAVYQDVLDNIETYYAASIQESGKTYEDISYEYALVDITGDGFPELLTAASKGERWGSADYLIYEMADVRVFSWQEAESRMVIPGNCSIYVGAAAMGGFRGALSALADGTGLVYSRWSSGTGAGSMQKLVLNTAANAMEVASEMDVQIGAGDQTGAFGQTTEITWLPVPGKCLEAMLGSGDF